ncbi:hypothetical protein HELRODRAFT_82443, partial [Helobdella robusta]|uniref:Rho-GAP domain-containing protein n=1 Tax=Helobdella robusta TaxID=6412 RepID=T1G4S3_HELRO
EDERWADVNVVSSLLKLFFRKLPEPLITTSLYRPAIDAIRHTTEVDRVRELKKILHKLPVHHFETFKYLSRHLKRVALKGDSNKMTANNISIVFGPTLICSREEHDVNSLIVDMPDQCRVVEACINHVS